MTVSDSAGSAPAADAALVPRRRRRGLVVLIALIVVLALLTAAAVIGETVVRQQATERVAAEVRAELGLPADQDVDVRIAGASVLLQLLGGRLDEIAVAVDDVAVPPFSGDLDLLLTGVPLESGRAIGSVAAVVTVPEDAVRAAGEGFLDLPFRGLELEDGLVRVGTAVPILGTELPLTVALAPSAEGGALVLTPTDVSIADGADVPLGDLLGLLGLDAEGGALAAPSICVDELLPPGVSLRSAIVTGAALVLDVGGEDVVRGGPGAGATGTCG